MCQYCAKIIPVLFNFIWEVTSQLIFLNYWNKHIIWLRTFLVKTYLESYIKCKNNSVTGDTFPFHLIVELCFYGWNSVSWLKLLLICPSQWQHKLQISFISKFILNCIKRCKIVGLKIIFNKRLFWWKE